MKIWSIIMVVIQLAGITLICVTAPPYCLSPQLGIPQVLGLGLLVWTWVNLHPGKFHIMPDPLKNTRIITTGPYRFIRHPMYLCLLLWMIPLLIAYFSVFRLIVMILFTANMVIKMFYEEHLLKKRYPEYADYMKKSKRLIPFVF